MDIKALVSQMTLEEKAGLCSGLDFWHTKPVERLGVERARRAAEAAKEMCRTYLEGCVGQRYEVLFEQPAGDGLFLGHAPNYAEVQVEGEALHNAVRPVRITGTDGEILFGRMEE